MASLVQGPINLLKWLIVPGNDSGDEAEFYAAEDQGEGTDEQSDKHPNMPTLSKIPSPPPVNNKCQPTTIITKDGRRIPPRTNEELNVSSHNHNQDTVVVDSRMPTYEHRHYSVASPPCTTAWTSTHSSLQLVSRPTQVPSERCLISPSGTVSDSFLPDKVVRIRRRQRMEKRRFLNRLNEQQERQRRKGSSSRYARSTSSHQSAATSGEQSEITLTGYSSSYDSHGYHSKNSSRKHPGVVLRSGRKLHRTGSGSGSRKSCKCCCCSQHFCHHKTHYLRGSRNPSCESVRRK